MKINFYLSKFHETRECIFASIVLVWIGWLESTKSSIAVAAVLVSEWIVACLRLIGFVSTKIWEVYQSVLKDIVALLLRSRLESTEIRVRRSSTIKTERVVILLHWILARIGWLLSLLKHHALSSTWNSVSSALIECWLLLLLLKIIVSILLLKHLITHHWIHLIIHPIALWIHLIITTHSLRHSSLVITHSCHWNKWLLLSLMTQLNAVKSRVFVVSGMRISLVHLV